MKFVQIISIYYGLFSVLMTACSEFVFSQQGTIPILLTAPHGGTLELDRVNPRTQGMLRADTHTLLLIELIANTMALQNFAPYVVGLTCKRKYIDVNRTEKNAYENEQIQPIYNAYHNQISEYIAEIKQKFPNQHPLLIDIHGQKSISNCIFRGTQNKKTVQKLLQTCGEDALSGPKSILGNLSDKGYTIFPSTSFPEDTEHSAYKGGFTVSMYGSHNNIGIDALQMEFGSDFRTLENIKKTASDIADSLITFHQTWQQ